MEIDFDPNKDARNRLMHGVSLAEAEFMDFESALVKPDDRRDYGEARFAACGWIGDRLHMLAFTMRDARLRAISLRRANTREVDRYERKV